MKKMNYVFITILVTAVLFFGGCTTKADTATFKICNENFVNVMQKFTSGSEYIFEPKLIESTDSDTYVVDLSSQKAYNNVIFEAINNDNFAEEGGSMNFGLLKKGNEYQTIVDAVTSYYARYQSKATEKLVEDISENNVQIPQNIYANLYNNIEKCEQASRTLAVKKTKLVTACKTAINQTNNYIQTSDFENYLQSYQDFIQTMADINREFQVLHYDYLFGYDENEGKPLPIGQTRIWVDSAILYCGIYYYIKDMKNSLSVQNAFAHIETQDESFASFYSILESRADKLISNESDSSAIFTFQVASKKLKAVINDIDNFDFASTKIKQYLQKNNLTAVDETRADFLEIKNYYQFATVFEQSILGLQTLINYYIQKCAN